MTGRGGRGNLFLGISLLGDRPLGIICLMGDLFLPLSSSPLAGAMWGLAWMFGKGSLFGWGSLFGGIHSIGDLSLGISLFGDLFRDLSWQGSLFGDLFQNLSPGDPL